MYSLLYLEKTDFLKVHYHMQRMRWLDSITDPLNGREFEQTLEIVEDRGAWHTAVHEVAKS